MQRADFHYVLPPELIAQRPLPERTAARLLCLDATSGALSDRGVRDLPVLLRPTDLLVLNDTRVVPARLHGRKDTGGQVEILIERMLSGSEAIAHVRASKPPRAGASLLLQAGVVLRVLEKHPEGLYRLQAVPPADFAGVLEAQGHMPLPPYIRRADEPADRTRYQTVYAARPGAVAAPTAGLHLDEALLAAIAGKGIATCTVTLHVGAGTFQPVREAAVDAHRMHAEWLEVDAAAVAAVAECRARGGRVVAVGTTAVRALETAALQGELAPYRGETRLFIRPGFPFRVVDCLFTNFHLPESTLLMLVCAFAGHAPVMAAYRHAVAAGYRFFSYGDAMWVGR